MFYTSMEITESLVSCLKILPKRPPLTTRVIKYRDMSAVMFFDKHVEGIDILEFAKWAFDLDCETSDMTWKRVGAHFRVTTDRIEIWIDDSVVVQVRGHRGARWLLPLLSAGGPTSPKASGSRTASDLKYAVKKLMGVDLDYLDDNASLWGMADADRKIRLYTHKEPMVDFIVSPASEEGSGTDQSM